ncbi:hypothetical protein FLO80_09575 [Aquicoccus porphyridii]|uniref:GspL cytoplasmic actin-ATPase-like domain-containing protein n=1 Tax=Aquicoccus porphyridii TaxID=1852029 RepID=A0A5A9ZGG4_9RHOB|nr:hypothetical protein FLO80_09575 [Aquicoccus porphyridii]RAI53528.1 hypothetical protein DOO74_11945 [Rhodobacteraceae bacterium AsT-22]
MRKHIAQIHPLENKKTVISQNLDVPPPVSDAARSGTSDPPLNGSPGTPLETLADLLPDDVKTGTTLIPAELVALHVVDLPVRTTRQRREALPYALEEAVGRPLEHTHFALCGPGEDGRVLAAAMDEDTLAAYLASAPGTALVPEQMVLRRPDRTIDGKETWRAYRRDDRVLVRVSDGTGFAVRNDMLHALWLSAERPAIESVGAPLGTDLVWSDHADTDLPHPGDLADADLRQGAYLPARGLKRPLKWLAAAVAVAALGHLAIAAFDLRAQRAIAEDLRADARAALATHLPDASIDDAPELILRRLAARNQPQVGSTFLPILERVAQALSRTGVAVQFRQLTWSDNAMRLTIEAPDLDMLQRAEASLRAANLQVSSGTTTADSGAARAELTVRP